MALLVRSVFKNPGYYLLLLFGFSLLIHSKALSQSRPLNKQNIVFVEAGGAVTAGVGLGYERYLYGSPSTRGTVRGGIGGVDRFSSLTSFIGSSLLFGKKSSLEIGLNYLINYDASTFRELDEDGEKYRNGFQALVGFRYQNWENGITFRLFYVPPLGCCDSYIPVYGGLSMGYVF